MSDKAMLGKPQYPRKDNELYLTPDWCTEVLLRNVEFEGLTWEPAAADGRMADVLFKNNIKTIATDIEPLDRQVKQHDFLLSPGPLQGKFKNIVTNPPYKLAQQFIEQAISIIEPVKGTVAMLLRNEYDSAATRQHLFSGCPGFSFKLVLTRRPKWAPGKGNSPRHNFSWFVWDFNAAGPPTLKWDQ